MDDRVLDEMVQELLLVVMDEGIDPNEIPSELVSTVDLYKKRGGEVDYDNDSFQNALIERVIAICDA